MTIGEAERSADWIKRNVVARRQSGVNGALTCVTCGSSPLSTSQFARVVGVSYGMVLKWLRKEPIRADVADKIRSSVLRVQE